MQNINENHKKIIILAPIILLTLALSINVVEAQGEAFGKISPGSTFGEFVVLTPGSATKLHVKTAGDFAIDFNHIFNVNITTVLCLGEGTLHVGLKKEDTDKELVTMLLFGFPTDPLFVPNFGFTPANISSNTDIQNTFGGFGIVMIVSGVHSDREPPHEYTLSIELD